MMVGILVDQVKGVMNLMIRFACPCCGFLTRSEAAYGSFDICPVCFWEDDNVQGDDPTYAGGANIVSLNQARQNYREFGAKQRESLDFVRKPHPSEFPDGGGPSAE